MLDFAPESDGEPSTVGGSDASWQDSATPPGRWDAAPGAAPIAVVMISLNEAHNMEAVLANLAGFAAEVHLVDSGSTDGTVEIARAHGVNVVRNAFEGFGAQWNFALGLPIGQPFTMKLDPDERLTPELKDAIRAALGTAAADGLVMRRRLWFMGRPMPVRQDILRVWRTGRCRFTDVAVNEHPIVEGRIDRVAGDLEHHDSPDLHHWMEKQNAYTTAEARSAVEAAQLGARPRLFGNALERRMWLKANYRHVPFRHFLMFLYCYLFAGAWACGRVGFVWARLRADLYRMIEYKEMEMRLKAQASRSPDGRVHRGA